MQRDEDVRRTSRAGWGGVARRGVRTVRESLPDEAPRRASRPTSGSSRPPATEAPPAPRPSALRRTAPRADAEPVAERVTTPPSPRAAARQSSPRPAPRPSRPHTGSARSAATPQSPSPRHAPRRHRAPVPLDVAAELRAAAPGRPGERAALRLADATRAYEADRYIEALSALRELSRIAAGVGAVRELHGLTLYRLGRYKEADRELRAAAALTDSVDQHPVLMDCARAAGRLDEVESLWTELRRAGASSDVLAEGRLVMAGALADAGRIDAGIALLESSARKPIRHPLDRHVRQWYALGDLYERSGDVPKARELFARVVAADPELSDAAERLAATR